VNISIYDIKGTLIEVLNNKILEKGNYDYNWNATNVSSGMYLIKVKTPNQTFIRKGLLTK
jgi:flagellar hook assembly protein FlgD